MDSKDGDDMTIKLSAIPLPITLLFALPLGCDGQCVETGGGYGDDSKSAGNDCSPTRENGCDDCNPCTANAWCDPAFDLPAVDFPSMSWICAPLKRTDAPRCFGALLTTAPGIDNDCFPVVGSGSVDGLVAGHCCAGVCSPNDLVCPNYGAPTEQPSNPGMPPGVLALASP